MGCGHQALCVPAEVVKAMLKPGFTFGTHEKMEEMLSCLMEKSLAACRNGCAIGTDVIWLTPFVLATNHADKTCFVSRRRDQDGGYFEPFSLGLAGDLRKDENPNHAALRILNSALGYTIGDVWKMDLVGFIQLNTSRAEKTHIAVVYRVMVNDLREQMIDGECLKGLWMSERELHKLYQLGALNEWSHYLCKAQPLTSVLTSGANTFNRLMYALLAG